MTQTNSFKSFATQRIVVGILAAIVVLWLIGITISFIKGSPTKDVAQEQESVQEPAHQPSTAAVKDQHAAATPADAHKAPAPHAEKTEAEHEFPWKDQLQKLKNSHPAPQHTAHPATEHETGDTHLPKAKTTAPAAAKTAHKAPEAHEPATGIVGVAFVDATIAPLRYELNDRFWGWRCNDILDVTDNINNFQIGVLEVTRRTAMVLSDSISRTGATAALDINIENAITWFMIGADKYWFPSAESKYTAGLNELEAYREKLIRQEANFYTRADNLIPLLVSFQNLLGSCDENLVKTKEENGSTVSSFEADDYLFYAKGVAKAMATILEAVEKDFHKTITARNGEESLHHAIVSCRKATQIDPWIVLESDLSGMLANHRANMATSISHARFYLDVLIRTLST